MYCPKVRSRCNVLGTLWQTHHTTAMLQGKLQAALEAYEEASCQGWSKHPLLHNSIASVHLALNQFSEALSSIEHALCLEAASPQPGLRPLLLQTRQHIVQQQGQVAGAGQQVAGAGQQVAGAGQQVAGAGQQQLLVGMGPQREGEQGTS
jgi:hypothetical protein